MTLYEQNLAEEQRIHTKYFQPFDLLLEKKAEYYLAKVQETGKENRFLLEEIEIMERLRQYVVMLENIVQERLTKEHHLAGKCAAWKNEAEYWKKEYNYAAQFGQLLQQSLLTDSEFLSVIIQNLDTK